MAVRSRQIGWSNKSNLLYGILKEFDAINCQICNTTSTTSTTSTTAIPCFTFWIQFSGSGAFESLNYINCNGDFDTLYFSDPQIVLLCARSVDSGGPFFNIVNIGAPCVIPNDCIFYQITNNGVLASSFSYTACNGFVVSEPIGGGQVVGRCAKQGTVTSGDPNITFTEGIPCVCISYLIQNTADTLFGSFEYFECEPGSLVTGTLAPLDSITVCAINPPTGTGGRIKVTPISICTP